MNGKLIVGSRESRLAVVQSMTLVEYLRRNRPDLEISLLTMKTTGDKILDRTLDRVGGKGLFVKELDLALREGRADLTVHSLKDMPMELPEELPLLCFSPREDPRDVLVLPEGVSELKEEAVIGTSSLRRSVQLRSIYPGHEIKPVRGNLQTRLRKLNAGEYGALVLAAAGLKRLGLEARISRYFTVEELIPAAGQGILAVQGRRGEDHSFLEGYASAESAIAAAAERSFVRELNGGCSSPVCAHAVLRGDRLTLLGLFYEECSGAVRRSSITGSTAEAEQLGIHLARKLRENREVLS